MKNKTLKNYVIMCGGRLLFFGGVVGIAVLYAKRFKSHPNVVIENKQQQLLVEDIHTKEKRIVEYGDALKLLGFLPRIRPGDTINIKTTPEDYKRSRILNWSCVDLCADGVRSKNEYQQINKTKINPKQR